MRATARPATSSRSTRTTASRARRSTRLCCSTSRTRSTTTARRPTTRTTSRAERRSHARGARARRPPTRGATSAFVEDCVTGEGGQSLLVADWLQMSPRPELEGVEKLGAVHHMGFDDQIGDNAEPPYPSTEDIFVSHEAELTQSGDYVLVTDERGGGVLPGRRELLAGRGQPARQRRHPRVPGRQARHRAAPAARSDRLRVRRGRTPTRRRSTRRTPRASARSSARRFRPSRRGRSARRTSSSRSRARTGSSWRWYSQGTQVVDFTENANGTIDFKRAGYFVPEHANQWVSHVFKVEEQLRRVVHLLRRDGRLPARRRRP